MDYNSEKNSGWNYEEILSESAPQPSISALSEHCEAEWNNGWTVVQGDIEEIEQHIRRRDAAKRLLYEHSLPSLTDQDD